MAQKNRVSQLRKKLGLTQRVLAEHAGTSQQQIARIEAGVQGVRLELANRIAVALGCQLAEIFPTLGSPRGLGRSSRTNKQSKLLAAGLDPDPKYWTARFFAFDGRTFEYEVSGDEKARLEKIFSDGRSDTAVFASNSQCVAMNPRKIAATHFLWEGFDSSKEEEDERCLLKLHLIGTEEPIVFGVEPDQLSMEDDEEGFSSQLQRLFFQLETAFDDDVVSFDDEDGERVYIRRTEVLAIEVPLICCEPALWNAHMEGSIEDGEVEYPYSHSAEASK